MPETPVDPRREILHMEEDRLAAGSWSDSLNELATQSGQLRLMLRQGRTAEARSLLQSQSAPAQAALVALDENPEEILSLTAMDKTGKPAYLPAIVDLLPSETLAQLIAPQQSKFIRFNAEVLRAMSPTAFARTVQDTLEPVDQQALRTRITWEWLQAVAALDDCNKMAQLLRQADWEVVEDTLLERLEEVDLDQRVPGTGPWGVSRRQALARGFTGLKPGDWVGDPEMGHMLNVLYQAAPDLVGDIMIRAGRRLDWMG
ncbi:MAG: hypothetical protein GKR89_10670 [Candidatus Latescibacteria bacterium]|nr:hypothetical protein [Candidatus Latescibacterota bacterium]